VKLVLFDIDGTILWSDGAGRRAMSAALTDVFGTAGPTSYHYDGKTDPQIVHDLMQLAGIPAEDIARRVDGLMRLYLDNLRSELATGDLRVRVFDGVRELLDALEQRDDIILGLLTGNIAEGATVKLMAAGIDPARFRVCAYGSDHHHRPELPGIALGRARDRLGLEIAGTDTIVIGDTPADIACGRGVGARTIAVATGRFSVEQLAEHEPYAVVETLRDTARLVSLIDRSSL
jgi:phosphoglycolate phosphatase